MSVRDELITSLQEANQLAISIVSDKMNPDNEYLCFPLDITNSYPTKSICKIPVSDFIPPSEM